MWVRSEKIRERTSCVVGSVERYCERDGEQDKDCGDDTLHHIREFEFANLHKIVANTPVLGRVGVSARLHAVVLRGSESIM